MISDETKEQYEQIFAQLKDECADFCDRDLYVSQLGVSRRKLSDFFNLKLYDIPLLMQMAAMHDYDLNLRLEKREFIFPVSKEGYKEPEKEIFF